MGFLLLIAALIIGLIILPLGLLYGLIKCFFKRHIGTGFTILNQKLLILAIALDIYANTTCPELLCDTLLTKDSVFPYGNYGETISEVTAANFKAGTLTSIGRWLAHTLIFFRDTAFPAK